MKIERTSGLLQRNVGPYSRALQRGVIGTYDGRSARGRYIRALEAEITATFTGAISATERLMIDRAVKLRLQLDAFDVKLQAATEGEGTWTDHDIRAYNSVGNQYRLILRELHGRSAAPRKTGRPSRQGIAALVEAHRSASA
jgi:hypothetical protein